MSNRPALVRTDPMGVDALAPSFDEAFRRIFRDEQKRLFGYTQRLCGDPDLAADVVQETFLRLHRRGSAPESVGSWLVTVATSLLRSPRTRKRRRLELLSAARADGGAAPPGAPEQQEERETVRQALERLGARDRQLLALLAAGYRYREMAAASGLNEASVGASLARAKRAFVQACGGVHETP